MYACKYMGTVRHPCAVTPLPTVSKIVTLLGIRCHNIHVPLRLRYVWFCLGSAQLTSLTAAFYNWAVYNGHLLVHAMHTRQRLIALSWNWAAHNGHLLVNATDTHKRLTAPFWNWATHDGHSSEHSTHKTLTNGSHPVLIAEQHVIRLRQNHIYTMHTRNFWQGNHQIYGHIRCKCIHGSGQP